jgi:ketosteroid isomerase-like protein
MLLVRPPAHGSTMTTTTSSESSIQTHLDAVRRLYAAYAAGDLDRVLDELADDVDWAAEAAGTSVPWYGPHRGKAEVPRFTVKATQRSATMYMQHWWRFADGKIAFFRGSEDSGQTIAAFQGA